MLLRASSEQDGAAADLNAVMEGGDAGVRYAEIMNRMVEHIIARDWSGLAQARDEAVEEMGPQQATDAMVVASAFNGITRVADSTGIPLDDSTVTRTDDVRSAIGIQSFDYENKTAKYDQ
jgi:hypothetical protein